MKLNFILLLGLVSTVLGSEQVLNQEIICFSNDVNYTFYIGKYKIDILYEESKPWANYDFSIQNKVTSALQY